MTLLDSLLLGTLQGLTEFLPISSSGHLVLLEHILKIDLSEQTMMAFDIILHAGTLAAIALYFFPIWWRLLTKPFKRESDGGPPLLILLIIGTIPAAIVGIFLKDIIESSLRTPLVVAIGFFITGGTLIGASYLARKNTSSRLGIGRVLAMGIGQVIGLLPGFSRSGWTIAGGMLSGLEKSRAAVVAFLLGAPALGGATVLAILGEGSSLAILGTGTICIGFASAFLASLLVMHGFLIVLRRYGLWIWSVYLFIAGFLLLALEYRPYLQEMMDLLAGIPAYITVPILFGALILEAVPPTSPFIPGTTMLATVGSVYNSEPFLLALCIVSSTIAVIIGHCLGYLPARFFGNRIHKRISEHPHWRTTERFFEKWGFWAVLVGGWWAPIRMAISLVAGLAHMPLKKYLVAIAIGSLLWTGAIILGFAFVFETVM
jgi:undecaprenyl-diphosphatase